jgi:hypothetical protein
MTQCIVYNIVNRNDEWHVLRGGASEPLARFKSKSDAVDRGRELAMREEAACLRISKIDGSIQSESMFGKDPAIMEGSRPSGGFR